MKVLRRGLYPGEAFQKRNFCWEMKKKTWFLLGEYFANNFVFEQARDLRFSPLKSAPKTTSG